MQQVIPFIVEGEPESEDTALECYPPRLRSVDQHHFLGANVQEIGKSKAFLKLMSIILNVRFNASVFNYGYTYNGFSDSRVSWSGRINLWTKLWKRLELFANARYSSPRLGLYSLSNANKSIDFGVSSDFLDRKLSVYLNVNDIFGWTEWGNNTTAPQYETTGSQRYNSRFVSLGLTWRMGKMELESKARQGATDSPMSQPGM